MPTPPRILIVDDDLRWCNEINEALSAYTLICALSVGHAQRHIEEAVRTNFAIDLAIVDLELPPTSGISSKDFSLCHPIVKTKVFTTGGIAGGLAVMALLHNHFPATPCIVFSGRTLPVRKAAGLMQQYGLVARLDKAEDMVCLVDVVRLALAREARPGFWQ